MLARFRAIEHLLGEVAIELRSLTFWLVLEHGCAFHRRVVIANRLANSRAEDEIAEILLQDFDRLTRVQSPLVVHRGQDSLNLDARIEVLAHHREGVLELDETAPR